MNIRTILAKAIRSARADARAGYLFDADEYEAGSRAGYHSGVIDTLRSLSREIRPQPQIQHIKHFRHFRRLGLY